MDQPGDLHNTSWIEICRTLSLEILHKSINKEKKKLLSSFSFCVQHLYRNVRKQFYGWLLYNGLWVYGLKGNFYLQYQECPLEKWKQAAIQYKTQYQSHCRHTETLDSNGGYMKPNYPCLRITSHFCPVFLFQAGRKDRSDALNTAIDRMTKKTRDLRRQVCFVFFFVFSCCTVLYLKVLLKLSLFI